MPSLQSAIRQLRRVIPRGWPTALRYAATVLPTLRRYPARLADGGRLVVDLRESMCMPYFFYGTIPHEREVERTIRDILSPGACFVDVGANVGYYTRMAARLVGAGGRAYAFEPGPRAFVLLDQNARGLGNVTVAQAAVGASSGSVRFYLRAMGDTSSLDPEGAAEAVEVPMVTLDGALRAAGRVDLIKIDVEGFELDVLRGATATMEWHRPRIVFEYIERLAADRGVSMRDYEAILHPLGYRLSQVGYSDILAVPQ